MMISDGDIHWTLSSQTTSPSVSTTLSNSPCAAVAATNAASTIGSATNCHSGGASLTAVTSTTPLRNPHPPEPPIRTSSCASGPPTGYTPLGTPHSQQSQQPIQAAMLGTYEEVPVHEPDPCRVPLRSALKGSKLSEQFQQQLEMKLKSKQQPTAVDEVCITTSLSSVANSVASAEKIGSGCFTKWNCANTTNSNRYLPPVARKPRFTWVGR